MMGRAGGLTWMQHLAGVGQLVHGDVALLAEHLCADRAGIRLPNGVGHGVGPLVDGDVGLRGEPLQNQRHKINADVSRSIT